MFARIKLPYNYDELEPYIDAATVETHYEKHHKTYMEKFNDLVKKAPELKGMSALEILTNLDKAPADIRTGLRNNGGGFYNHNLYFESLIPGGAKAPASLTKRIEKEFGDTEALLEKLYAAAKTLLFGSGYAWLVAKNGMLDVVISANQDLPDQQGGCTPLLPVDMWEHAYYLKHKNAKTDYVKDFFSIVNWEVVAERLDKAK